MRRRLFRGLVEQVPEMALAAPMDVAADGGVVEDALPPVEQRLAALQRGAVRASPVGARIIVVERQEVEIEIGAMLREAAARAVDSRCRRSSTFCVEHVAELGRALGARARGQREAVRRTAAP